VPGATGAGAPFEPRATGDGTSTAIGTSATAVGAATTVGASATAIAATVASAATERALEAGTRISADARGVAREFFKRGSRTTDARSASFAREENHVLFDDRCAFDDGSTSSGGGEHFLFDVPMPVVLGLLFAMLVRAVFGVVFGMFLSHVRREFSAVGGASSFYFRDFFLGEFRDLNDWSLFGFLSTFFGMFFRVFFFKFGAADDGIGLRFFRSFFVLGFHETGSEGGDLIFVQLSVIPGGFESAGSRFLGRLGDLATCDG
jgi:hypothetical protein